MDSVFFLQVYILFRDFSLPSKALSDLRLLQLHFLKLPVNACHNLFVKPVAGLPRRMLK